VYPNRWLDLSASSTLTSFILQNQFQFGLLGSKWVTNYCSLGVGIGHDLLLANTHQPFGQPSFLGRILLQINTNNRLSLRFDYQPGGRRSPEGMHALARLSLHHCMHLAHRIELHTQLLINTALGLQSALLIHWPLNRNHSLSWGMSLMPTGFGIGYSCTVGNLVLSVFIDNSPVFGASPGLALSTKQ